ncbi:hypothetical protein AURDEDRAFT_160792 [Auricularia subglabra TFB-10046 SS5]|nr:hypothetical protein AURDEDRAFT_160792 [Auricularia subglabra TFB-10046 SS5]
MTDISGRSFLSSSFLNADSGSLPLPERCSEMWRGWELWIVGNGMFAREPTPEPLPPTSSLSAPKRGFRLFHSMQKPRPICIRRSHQVAHSVRRRGFKLRSAMPATGPLSTHGRCVVEPLPRRALPAAFQRSQCRLGKHTLKLGVRALTMVQYTKPSPFAGRSSDFPFRESPLRVWASLCDTSRVPGPRASGLRGSAAATASPRQRPADVLKSPSRDGAQTRGSNSPKDCKREAEIVCAPLAGSTFHP